MAFAESFGVEARRPETREELADASQWTVGSEEMAVVEVSVVGTAVSES